MQKGMYNDVHVVIMLDVVKTNVSGNVCIRGQVISWFGRRWL